MARAEVAPVAADLDGTAGGDQLAAYLEREKGQIRTCQSPDDLFATLQAAEIREPPLRDRPAGDQSRSMTMTWPACRT
jgi:hypothetical protein